MTIEIYASSPTPPIIIAADAACNVVVPGIPSSYNTDDEDDRERGIAETPSARKILSNPEKTGRCSEKGTSLVGPGR